MKDESRVIMALLQMQFPTSFFDGQQHLMIHVVDEVTMAGPMPYRWMFFVERYMKTLKDFVRQKTKPEGSISEGYLLQEALEVHHNTIGHLDEYAPRVWKEFDDKRITCTFLYLYIFCMFFLFFCFFNFFNNYNYND
jgi:hypothetical protein